MELPKQDTATEHVPAVASLGDSTRSIIAAYVPASMPSTRGGTNERFPASLMKVLPIIRDQNGRAYIVMRGTGNAYAIPVNGQQAKRVIRELANAQDHKLSRYELDDLVQALQEHAESSGTVQKIWSRVAPSGNGIEIDCGDENHTHVRILPGQVEVVMKNSGVLFFRTLISQPMAIPAATGNLKLLDKYLNMSPIDATLLVAWLSFTLAQPKVRSAKYPILVLQGNEGSGKSSLCQNVIQPLIDPSSVGVQALPSNTKDLAIACQNAHVSCYDNIRGFNRGMADMLCVAATGGAITGRQLYTDDVQQVIRLHGALILNGIHSFVNQPDLAQRCVTIQMKTMPKEKRQSEADISRNFEADLPFILRGMFDLIAEVFVHLPSVAVSSPERMLDFVKWLAAMEIAQGVPAGVYQSAYSQSLNLGQLETLMDNSLAASILEFAESLNGKDWVGTPRDLLVDLIRIASIDTQKARDWPQNPISLSKRLIPLQAGLLTQGISVQLHRGKHRTITISQGVVDAKVSDLSATEPAAPPPHVTF